MLPFDPEAAKRLNRFRLALFSAYRQVRSVCRDDVLAEPVSQFGDLAWGGQEGE